jgi:maleate isomerase
MILDPLELSNQEIYESIVMMKNNNQKEVNTMNETISELQLIIEELLRATQASRTTLRMDIPEQNCHVDGAVVEATISGIRSIKVDTSIDQRKTPTYKFVEANLCNLVQDDCINAEVSPPPELMQVYGTKAQMVGPIIRDNKLIGWVSVHYVPSTRHWNEVDIAALDDAKRRVMTCLEKYNWVK